MVVINIFRRFQSCILYSIILHCVDVAVILNFQISHGSDQTVFEDQLIKFLAKDKDTPINDSVRRKYKRMLRNMQSGHAICNVQDFEKYFPQNYIRDKLAANMDRITFDEETKNNEGPTETRHITLDVASDKPSAPASATDPSIAVTSAHAVGQASTSGATTPLIKDVTAEQTLSAEIPRTPVSKVKRTSANDFDQGTLTCWSSVLPKFGAVCSFPSEE